MEMNKKEKIFKICLVTFLTLLGVGGMTCFALSAELAAIPATYRLTNTTEAIPEVHQALNEIGVYLDFLKKVENGSLILPSPTGAEPESREVKSSENSGDITLAELNELAFYLGRIKRMETAVSGYAENSEVKSATEPEHQTPEIIEVSHNQNGELNYLKVVWDNRDNEPDDKKDTIN
jgi:hypothetical protein